MDLGFAGCNEGILAARSGKWVLERVRRGWYLCECPIRTEQEDAAPSHDRAAGHAAGR